MRLSGGVVPTHRDGTAMNGARKFRGRQAAAVLLGVQLVLVLSIAAKYLYERKTRPRVWVRSAQFDPNEPLRGRYLALQLMVDACGLPQDGQAEQWGLQAVRRWNVQLEARDGKLVAVENARPKAASETQEAILFGSQGCDQSRLRDQSEYFIPDTARGPFPLKKGEELWVEVTVPKQGPPRPIQIALSDAGGFRVLKF